MNRYTYEEITVGQTETFSIQITEEMMQGFCAVSGDCNPLHTDSEFAKSRGHRDRVVYGMLTASFLSTLAGMYLPGEKSLIHRVETEFPAPVYINDTLHVSGTVVRKEDAFRTIELKVVIRNQDEKKVCRGKMRIGVIE